MKRDKVCVLVAGSWGTALASVLADNELDVVLWTRNQAQADEINELHTNERYHPGVELSRHIRATTSMEEAVDQAKAVLIVAPSASMRGVARDLNKFLKPDQMIIHATKGFELDGLKRMSVVLGEELDSLDDSRSIVVLSGPSHAEEVIKRRPTTVVVASESEKAAESAQDLLINSYFRVYTNSDLIGVEVSGALKNIIALAAGLSDGLGFGDNAKAALLTRGLAEISRLGVAMGANPLTFAGLAGVGDLIVTCTSSHSRNWRAGSLLAQGKSMNEVLASMGMVVEGVKTTKAAHELAKAYDVHMPISEQLYEVLFDGKSPQIAVGDLMGRGKTNEIEELTDHSKERWFG